MANKAEKPRSGATGYRKTPSIPKSRVAAPPFIEKRQAIPKSRVAAPPFIDWRHRLLKNAANKAEKPRNDATVYDTIPFRSPKFLQMANTYTQMYAQIVFSPKGRENLILETFEERLYQYITGIVQERGQKLIAINGMPDHLHIFIGFKPTLKISELVADIKVGATKFIKSNHFLPGTFSWQDGYGCFTYAHTQVDAVAKYVMNQKEHHKKASFREEYCDLLQKFEVAFDENYLFEFYDLST